MLIRARAALALTALLALLPGAIGAQTQAPYTIGVTYPLTGPLAAVAAEYLKGADLAIADVNKAGGVNGHPLRLVVEDTLGTPQGGVTAMRKLAQANGVQAILTVYTNVVTAQIPLADDLKVPAISTVESPGLFARSTYSFSHAPTWGVTLPLMTQYWRRHGVKRVFGMLTNSAIGQLQTAAIRNALLGTGVEYADGLLDLDATDFRGVVARARDFKPDAIVFTGQGATIEAAGIKQVREMGIKAGIYSMGQDFTNKSFREAIGPYSEGMVLGGLNLDESQNKAYWAAFKALAGYDPSYISAEVYDIIKMYAYAIGKAGYNGEAIQKQLVSLKGLPSVMGGTVTMGPEHYTQFSAVGLWKVTNGKLARTTPASP